MRHVAAQQQPTLGPAPSTMNEEQHHQEGQPETASGSIADSLHARKAPAAVYESQISPELEGIKLKIKKSPTQVAHAGAPAEPKKPRKQVGFQVRMLFLCFSVLPEATI